MKKIISIILSLLLLVGSALGLHFVAKDISEAKKSPTAPPVVEDQVEGNLLKEKLSFESVYSTNEAGLPDSVFATEYSIGLEAYATYKIDMTIDGEDFELEKMSHPTGSDFENSVMLGAFESGEYDDIILTVNDREWVVAIVDKTAYDSTFDSQFVADENATSFIVMSQDMSKENAVEVEIRSIVKTKEADPYPGNLLSEPFAFKSIDASNETIPALPSLDKSLGLVEGQTYKVVFSIDGEIFELEKPCFAGDTPNNIGVEGALTLSNMTNTNGLIVEVGDYRVVILIAQDAAVVDSNFAYQQGTTSFLAQATVSDGYLADVIFDIVITAIVPVA